jgi:ferredoxin
MSGVNAIANRAASAAADALQPTATSLIEYQSRGRVLIIGATEPAAAATEMLSPSLTAQILRTDGSSDAAPGTTLLNGRNVEINGHLGNFRVHIGIEGTAAYQMLSADMILDLCRQPLLGMPLKPPGYFACPAEAIAIESVVRDLDDMTGVFEKPRYFSYDPAICAHERSGQIGCNRCLEACPADAITALAERIEVDPFRCQGGGICSTVCPSGAIRYAYPALADLLDRVRKLIHTYLDNGGEEPILGLVAEADIDQFEGLPDNVLLVVLEELASAGLEVWLAALAYGANQVVLFDGGSVPESVSGKITEQIEVTGEIIGALGMSDMALVRHTRLEDLSSTAVPARHAARSGFAGLNDKRNMAFAAVDALSDGRGEPVLLPKGAPFGRIRVNGESCTLCMACTSVCPAAALVAGGNEPRLLFHELNCVQCGICAQACPESAIGLEPRLNLDVDERRRGITLHQEAPFNCVSCGKPFTTASAVANILGKLENHPMFGTERARRRLEMCEDCRVVDVVQDDDAMGGIPCP